MDMTKYVVMREQIQTGDLLAVSGKGWVSKTIKWWSKGAYSHVGLLIRLDQVGIQRVFLLHSTAGTGVVLLPLARYLTQLKGTADFLQLRREDAVAKNPAYQSSILKFAFQQLGRGYDGLGVLKFALPLLRQKKENYFCSELAASAYRYAKLTDQESFVDPGALAEAPIFKSPVSFEYS